MPARNRPAAAPREPGRRRRQVSRAEAERIRAERARLVAQVARLRQEPGVSPAFLAKAQELLTRWWSRADWVGREQILKAADWLIRLEQRRGGGARTGKHGAAPPADNLRQNSAPPPTPRSPRPRMAAKPAPR